jgi:hypothetical protein
VTATPTQPGADRPPHEAALVAMREVLAVARSRLDGAMPLDLRGVLQAAMTLSVTVVPETAPRNKLTLADLQSMLDELDHLEREIRVRKSALDAALDGPKADPTA